MKKTILALSVLAMSVGAANSVHAGCWRIGTTAGGDCWGYGICGIFWASEPGAVNATFAIDVNGSFIMTVSQSDMQQLFPQYLPHFNTQTNTVDFPNEWIAPASFNQQIGALNPVRVLPGSYSFTIDKNNNFVVVIPQQIN